jgi:hypothetical protein
MLLILSIYRWAASAASRAKFSIKISNARFDHDRIS